MTLNTLLTILGILGLSSLPAWFNTIKRMGSFISHQFAFPDISIGILDQSSTLEVNNLRIKAVNAGKSDVIWDASRIKADLKIPSASKRFLFWIKLIVGYFSYDINGLEAVLGTEEKRRGHSRLIWRSNLPIWFKKLVCKVDGFMTGYMFMAVLAMPFAFFVLLYAIPQLPVSISYIVFFLFLSTLVVSWIFVFSSPLAKFSLLSDNDSILIKDETGANISTPFFLHAGQEMELSFSYKWNLVARGFASDTKVMNISEIIPTSWWKLPRKGEFVMLANEEAEILIKGRIRHYPLKLKPTLIKIG